MRAVSRQVVTVAGRQHVVHTSARPKCNRLLVYFGGDQLGPDAALDLQDPEVIRLAQVPVQAGLMCQRFPDSAVVAIEPCRLADGYACYDNFLVKCTASGEPLGYTGQGLKAVTLLHDLLKAALGDVLGLSSQQHPPITWVLVGFSKGTVVLNQILTELAWMAEHCAAEEHVQLRAFLRGLQQVHYVDAGLNCRGAHITDPSTTAALGAAWRTAAGGPLSVALHGTPRQWDDKRRPWIRRELEVFQRLLEQAQVPVGTRRYLEGQPPGLLMHFRALEVFDPNSILPETPRE